MTAINLLTEKERSAYDSYIKTDNRSISTATQAQWFSLFLRGKSCFEIQRLNSGFHLGAVVKCRIEGDWDAKLQQYRESLFDGVREKLQQTELESIEFLSDMLAAAHKQHGDRIKRYLQTGNEAELGDMLISSVRAYKEVLELITKITGQERQQHVQHVHQITTDGSIALPSNPTSDQAEQLLRLLASKDVE